MRGEHLYGRVTAAVSAHVTQSIFFQPCVRKILTLTLGLEIEVDREGVHGVGAGRRRMADNTGGLQSGGGDGGGGSGGGYDRSGRGRIRVHGGNAVAVGDGRGDRRHGRDGERRDGGGGGRRRGRRRSLLVAAAFLRLFLDLDLVEDRRRCHSALHFHAREPCSHLRAVA